MSDEFHWLSLVVDERVLAAQLLDANRPRKALGSWSLLFTNKGENCGGYLGPTARSKQSEVSHRMTIASGDVLRPPVDELLDCAPHRLPSVRCACPCTRTAQTRRRYQECVAPRRADASHSVRRSSGSVPFRRLAHACYTMCALLFLEQTFHHIARHSGVKLARLQRPAQKCNHQPLPAAPQFVAVKEDA